MVAVVSVAVQPPCLVQLVFLRILVVVVSVVVPSSTMVVVLDPCGSNSTATVVAALSSALRPFLLFQLIWISSSIRFVHHGWWLSSRLLFSLAFLSKLVLISSLLLPLPWLFVPYPLWCVGYVCLCPFLGDRGVKVRSSAYSHDSCVLIMYMRVDHCWVNSSCSWGGWGKGRWGRRLHDGWGISPHLNGTATEPLPVMKKA